MLRNALRSGNLSPSAAAAAARTAPPFICRFCALQPPLPRRYISTTLPACKNRPGSGKRFTVPAPDPASEEALTELRKDIKESVARKNEEKESKRWKKKTNNDAEPATSEVAAEARDDRQRRRKEKAKAEKAKRKDGTAPEIAREKVKREREKVKLKREGQSQHAPFRRMPAIKELGGVSLATALGKRTKDKNMLTMNPGEDTVKPIDMNDSKKPPAIKHDLDRVLFNPGVHYLQDPRSHVYNFDPYLRDIMPVTEFDFAAVDSYITSSRDTKLSALAASLGKKYVGSTSSMTSVLSHFHYLLSHWRNINIGALSKDFPAEYNTFTHLSRAPAAVFLRYKGNGTYAIDPDKEFDMDSILSLLGRSLEKMLTLAPADYAGLRLDAAAPPAAASGPDTFHYSTLGDFLMRSQLDAHDPRLPGTGMFDLKTRAVVSVRMDVTNFHLGSGYQIKTLKGQWESFEREYFDMIRAAFLKYSLQVRMGRMDGIFVAFHNTERIFGFQYVSLDEMDASIHEAWGSGVGQREFVLSLMFLNEALNRSIERFPEQSLRLHFETRETQTPQMYITAEPMSEADIDEIQSRNTRDLNEFLKSLEAKRGSVQRKAEFKGIAEKFGEVEEEEAAEAETAVDVEEEEGGEKAGDVESAAEADVIRGELEVPAWESGQRGAEGAETAERDVREKEADESGHGGTEGVESAGNTEMTGETGTDDQGVDQTAQDEDYDEDGDYAGTVSEDDDDEAEDDDNDDDDDAEEIPDEHLETAIPDSEADLDITSRTPVLESDRPLLAMTLTTYNLVNGKQVLRPGVLRPSDKWTVDYTITEAKTNQRAWGTYNSIKSRRRKAVESTSLPEDSDEVSQYVKYLRTLSKSGRAWAAEQEAMFGKDKVVYKGGDGEE